MLLAAQVAGHTLPWDKVEVWPLPAVEPQSGVYRVMVNGTPVPVGRYQADGVNRSVAVAHFAFSGTARVRVKFVGKVPDGLVLSPRRLQLAVRVVDDEVSFTLDRPRKLALHFGGKDGLESSAGLTEKLFLFADSLEPEPLMADGQPVTDAQQAGVPGRAGEFVAERLQALLDALPEGGTLRLGPGTYDLDRGIVMPSRRTVRIDAGALVRFTSVNPGGKGMFHFSGVEEATLKGRGTLHLNGSRFRNGGAGFSTCQAVRIDESRHIRVEGLTLRDAGNINIFVTDSDDNLFRDLKIIADADFSNTDGIGLNDGCERNTAEDLFIYNTDDCAVGGWREDMSRFTVRHAVLWNHGTGRAFKAGTEFPGRRYSWFNWENCDVIHCQSMIELTWENDDGVPRSSDVAFEHFFVKNIHIESPPENRTIQVCCGNGKGLWFQNIFFAKEAKWAQGNGFRHEAWGGGRVWSRIEEATIQHLVIGGRVITGAAQAGFEHNPEKQKVRFISTPLPQIEVSAASLAVRPGNDAVFLVRRSGDVSRELHVAFQRHGSAVAGRDYTSLHPCIILSAGAAEARLAIPTLPSARAGVTLMISLESEMGPRWAVGCNYLAQTTLHPEAP